MHKRERADPAMEDVLAVAKRIGISRVKSKEIAEHVRQIVSEELGDIMR